MHFSLSPNFSPRLYQETIVGTATSQNTLVVLPTGLGKTAIAAMVASHRLSVYPKSKILFLAPTRPLVEQHIKTFKEFYPDATEEDFAVFTGYVKPEKRQALWKTASIIFSTPQGLENDVMSRKITLEDVSLLVFDEAHRATGDYSYNFIAKTYVEQATKERILALTASPGSDKEKIKEVSDNLFIESIEVKSSQDPDVKQYVQEVEMNYVTVELEAEHKRIHHFLSRSYESKLTAATALGELSGTASNYNKTTLLKAQAALHAKMATGEKSFELLKTISLLAEALKVQHALELCESQTLGALSMYLSNLQTAARKGASKAVQNLVIDPYFKGACELTNVAKEKGIEHPKIAKLKELITTRGIGGEKKAIIFTQFRDTANVIKNSLTEIASAEVFVGQAKKNGTGLTQKEQKQMLEHFREGKFSILIATSVAEEGLDIPSVDTVMFYEPVPSAIRTVQRRGRTGRHDIGNVIMLLAKGTRDEGYRWSAFHKEKRMYRVLDEFKRNFTPQQVQRPQQKKIGEFQSETLEITVDYREKGSAVMKTLLEKNTHLTLGQLKVGDYQIGSDIVVEYKHVKDFVDSIIDGRLLSQLRDLRSCFTPVIIIEGQEDIYAQRRISPEAIRGMLATIISSYHIPLLRTTSPQETAGVLQALARKKQSTQKAFQQHTAKPLTEKEQQEYIVSSLPGVGATLAKPLLEHFGSVMGVCMATVDELKEVPLIGEKKAQSIRDVLDAMYKK